MSIVPERRQYHRHTATFSAKYALKSGTFRDLIRNLSAGGIFVTTRRKIDRGQPISLEIPVFVFDKRLRMTGKVVRCNTDGFAVKFDKPIEEIKREDVP